MSDVRVVKVNEQVSVSGNVYVVAEGALKREGFKEELKISGYSAITVSRDAGSDFVDIYIGVDEDETALSKPEINALIALLGKARDHA